MPSGPFRVGRGNRRGQPDCPGNAQRPLPMKSSSCRSLRRRDSAWPIRSLKGPTVSSTFLWICRILPTHPDHRQSPGYRLGRNGNLPNFLRIAADKHIPVMMMNGRISQRSAVRYRLITFLRAASCRRFACSACRAISMPSTSSISAPIPTRSSSRATPSTIRLRHRNGRRKEAFSS